MSVKIMSAIFETEFRDLVDEKGNTTKAATAKLVLLAMADHANDEGEGTYPSVETLARKTALSHQTIRNTWDALRYNGIISLAGSSKYKTNNHTINMSCFPRLRGEDDGILTLYPLDPLTGNVDPSNRSLKTLYRLDPNHQLTTKEPSRKTDETKPDYVTALLSTKSEKEIEEEEACKAFERALGFNSLPWHSTGAWTKMARFVTDIHRRDRLAFGNYIAWRGDAGKYKAMSNKQIRMNPQVFMDTGWAEFENDSKTDYNPQELSIE